MALVPNIVDQRAQTEPEALYAEYPVSTLSYEEGYRKITYGGFANAINGAAWWLHKNLGPGKDFETLAYIGPNDLRYPALILGAVKAGYTVITTSSPQRTHIANDCRCSSPHPATALQPKSTFLIDSNAKFYFHQILDHHP